MHLIATDFMEIGISENLTKSLSTWKYIPQEDH